MKISTLHHRHILAIEKSGTEESVDDLISSARKKRAAITSLSAATVTAKIFVNHEEDQIRQLVSMMIEKQVHRIDISNIGNCYLLFTINLF